MFESNNNLPASAQTPYGDSTAVDFIYARFGVAFIESTPNIAVSVLCCPPDDCYGFPLKTLNLVLCIEKNYPAIIKYFLQAQGKAPAVILAWIADAAMPKHV